MILVAISVIAPVNGTVFCLIAIVLLRAGRITSRMIGKRRARRAAAGPGLPRGLGGVGAVGPAGPIGCAGAPGPPGAPAARPRGGGAIAVALFPLALVRAMLGLLLLAPVALLGFVIAGAITVIMVPVNWLPMAMAAGAGTLVAITGLGPGSAAGREAMAAIYSSIAPTPARRLIAYLGVIALAVWVGAIALGQPAAFGSAIDPRLSFFRLPSVNSFLQQARMSVLNLAHRYGL